MATDPLRRRPEPAEKPRPKIWTEGGQRPPFVLRAFGRAGLHLSRVAVAPVLAWAARRGRMVAVNVSNGAGRLPPEKLGRAARFVPSHLRVAGWIANSATALAHASATADPEVKRGNALVSEIEPYLWAKPVLPTSPTVQTEPVAIPPTGPSDEVAPVVLTEPTPEPMQPGDDPLASIRDELDGAPPPGRKRSAWPAAFEGPDLPPAPPGPLAVTAIQVTGYMIGWGVAIIALPYGLGKALWWFIKGVDLRGIGTED